MIDHLKKENERLKEILQSKNEELNRCKEEVSKSEKKALEDKETIKFFETMTLLDVESRTDQSFLCSLVNQSDKRGKASLLSARFLQILSDLKYFVQELSSC